MNGIGGNEQQVTRTLSIDSWRMVKVLTTLTRLKFNRQVFMTYDIQQSTHASFFPTETRIQIEGGFVTKKPVAGVSLVPGRTSEGVHGQV